MAGECWSHVVRVAADSDSYSEPPGWGWPGNKGQLKTYHLANSLLPAAAAISLSVHMLPSYPAYLDHDGDGEGLLVRRHDHLVADGSWGGDKEGCCCGDLVTSSLPPHHVTAQPCPHLPSVQAGFC